jgi:hypothetical protein
MLDTHQPNRLYFRVTGSIISNVKVESGWIKINFVLASQIPIDQVSLSILKKK